MASQHYNKTLGWWRKRVAAMNYSEAPITLQGNTMGAVGLGPTRLEAGKYYAQCFQCKGVGVVNFEGAIDDPYRMGLREDERKTCFKCNKAGEFLLPDPTHLAQACMAWVWLRIEQDRRHEVPAMAISQIECCNKWPGPFQAEMRGFWQEIMEWCEGTDGGFTGEPRFEGRWYEGSKVTFRRHVYKSTLVDGNVPEGFHALFIAIAEVLDED